MIRVGLTGGCCTGKSAVAEMFSRLGAKVVSADGIVHRLLREDEKVRSGVCTLFGEEVMAPDGSVDREKLAGIVFSDKKSLSALTGLLYPGVKSEIRRVFEDAARQGEHEVCVAEVPLLIEDGELDMYDFIVVVRAKYENQLRRFLQRGGTSAADLDRRIANQMDLAEKVKYADAVVENDGSIEETFQQVKDIFQEIRRRKRRFPGGSSGNSSDGDLGDTSNKGKKSRRDSFLYQRR